MLNIRGYSDLKIIHQSTNSIVYEASRELDRLKVALKTPAQQFPWARRLSALNREYEILQNCAINSIPQAMDLIDTGPAMVLVLEYIDAPSLRSMLYQRPMGLDAFFKIALQVLEILSNIHRHNLIHRDLSPSNILYNPDGDRVWVIDFGSSLESPRQARAVINPHHVEGSRAYMSPEQTGRINRGLDFRTDFYSLGVIFYEMLTGRLPFLTRDHNELVHCHIAVPPKPPIKLVSQIPQVLSDIVLKLMSKDAADRYQSSDGIHADLVKCKEMLAAGGTPKVFALAQEDINDRFIIPEKLYGREAETKELLEVFEKTSDGFGGMAFVSGQAGVGKTSLIKELYKPLTAGGGYIAGGKFDQYHRHLPYSALMEAFASLIGQILSESSERVEAWRNSITQALGANGRLLIDVMPDLELLIGPQPVVAELPVAESRARFTNLFQSFVDVFGDSGQPLVLFLDDLQWIDSSSLALLEAMSNTIGSKSMLIIGAYRSNEVPETHRLAISLAELRKSMPEVCEIKLRELAPQSLMELLGDTLYLPQRQLEPLNAIMLEKTGGNPLFFKTMLNTLYADGYVKFDREQKAWTWNQEAMASAPYADTVVEMLQSRIPSLSGGQVGMLAMAASLGNPFELDLTAKLAGVSRSEAARSLQPAISAGLIQPLDGDYELYMTHKSKDMPCILIRFAHDRIQQAAYSLMQEEQRPGLHWRIGQLLLSRLGEADTGKHLFDAVANLNLGAAMASAEERLKLARLNLRAGKKAKESAAFGEAYTCLLAALDLLEDDCWKTRHEHALDIHLELAEACYLVSDFERAEELYKLIRLKAANQEDVLTLINIQAKQCHHQGRYQEAIALEREGLSLLGIDLPGDEADLMARFMGEREKINGLLGGAQIESLYELPEVDDPSLTLTHEILFDLFADSYLTGQGAQLACAAAISTRLSLERGNCPMTSIGYINYATCLCAAGEYVMGHAFGRLAVKLADKYRVSALKNYTYHLFALSINHWMEPLETSYSYWREASKLALESGSPYAGWVFLQLAHVLLASGAPLDRVEEQIAESHEYLTSAQLNDIGFMLKLIVAQPVKHLRGRTRDITSLDDEQFNAGQIMEDQKEALFFLSHVPYSLLRAKLLGRDIQTLETMSQWMPLFEQTMQGQFIHVDCYFYFTLHLTAGYGDLPQEQRGPYLEAIEENKERFEKWAQLCPSNFKHKYLLIAAEKARLENDVLAAMDLYDQSIKAAYTSFFLQDAALANELAGLFWKAQGKPHLSTPYLQQALATYERWGAKGKVADLIHIHPGLTQQAAADSIYQPTTVSTSTSTGVGGFSAQLDLMSIIKASQTVSQHMVLDKLAGELVNLAMENAGATMAVLLINQSGEFVEVRRKTDANFSNGDDCRGNGMPKSVINYVIRSGKSVVLDDVPSNGQFSRSRYLAKYGPKSLCCIPIIKQKEIKGVLYLENSQVRGAFQKERLQLLNMIASQASISLENANMFQELDNMNKNLEQKVFERTRELDEKNRMLELLSTTDQLTGLYNRRHLENYLRNELERSERYGSHLSVILLDIDRFKAINDNQGHDVGDMVLISLAKTLKKNTRITDVAGRWGGEEFLILLPGTGAEASAFLAEKLRKALLERKHGPVDRITASFGVAEYRSGDTIGSLIKRADQGLYAAKENGRNQVVVS